jgi:hypothetical protein
MKFSASDPSLTTQSLSSAMKGSREVLAPDPLDVENRVFGNVRWNTRTLFFGQSKKVGRDKSTGEKVPWVSDHHITETMDNHLMNPMNRHYFDKDGIESSFRNRGRHHGRPARDVFGKFFDPKGASPTACKDKMGRTA